MKALLIQVRREFWEHRSLWIAPLAIGVVLLLAAAIFGRIQLDFGGPAGGPGRPRPLFELMLLSWAVPFYLAAAILASIYLLDCLYGERRDRSILFWRSMPVSDTETVLSKLLVGLVIVPLGTFLLAAVTSILASAILALRNHALLLDAGGPPLWNTLSWLRMQGIMLYGLIATLLWYAPYATYLMLASIWARRSPYAWAFIPPVLLAIFEHMVFGTNHIGRVVERGFGELLHLAFRLNEQIGFNVGDVIAPPRGGGGARILMRPLNPSELLSSPQLWLGLLAAAVMVLLTIRLRRYRDDS
jgi:ABC-2 type transport system permease protein